MAHWILHNVLFYKGQVWKWPPPESEVKISKYIAKFTPRSPQRVGWKWRSKSLDSYGVYAILGRGRTLRCISRILPWERAGSFSELPNVFVGVKTVNNPPPVREKAMVFLLPGSTRQKCWLGLEWFNTAKTLLVFITLSLSAIIWFYWGQPGGGRMTVLSLLSSSSTSSSSSSSSSSSNGSRYKVDKFVRLTLVAMVLLR